MVNKLSGDGQSERRRRGLRCWLMLYSLPLLITLVWPAGASEFRVANLRQLKVEAVGGQVHYEKPNWSPDGTALAFETRRGKERRLWVQILDSGVTHELLSKKSTTVKLGGAVPGVAAVANYDATWSIGGDKITYVGSGQHGYFGLFYVAFGDWVNPVRFVAGGDGDPYVAFPDYHPKADLVVFSMGEETSRRGEGRLDLHAAESLPPVQGRNIPSSRVLQAGAMEGVPQLQPEFSPDGGMIAFVGIRRGNNDIYTLPVLYHPRAGLKQRGEPTRLTSWSAPEVQPSWSPDGQQIAFLSGHQESREEWGLWVRAIQADGEAQRLQPRVMAEDKPEWYDEDHIFFVSVDEEAGNPLTYVNTNTGAVRRLDLSTLRHVYIEISADGRRIALCARGERTDPNLTWLKLYVGDLIKE
jgi:Tol biopolymer transport system component